MPASGNPRNYRNNPYAFDFVAVRFHHSAAGVLWRWRAELLVILTITASVLFMARAITGLWTVVVITVVLVVVMAVPSSRRYVLRRAWCVVTRHRLQRVCFETRMHTRSGRLPLILRIRPTEVGERALIWCRSPVCAEDFEAHAGELAAGCYAREARITRNRKWSQLVTVDIVRRDMLAPETTVASDITPVKATTNSNPDTAPLMLPVAADNGNRDGSSA
jgi:hypothetical protein